MTGLRKFTQEIAYTQFPEACFDQRIEIFQSLINKAMANDSKLEDGYVKLGDLDKNQKLVLFFVSWVSVNNEIIDNLNMVIRDISTLPHLHLNLQEEPLIRYKFLIRMFFYEFYRFREKYNQVIKDSVGKEFIEKKDVPELRALFQSVFKETIELRNSLVHGQVGWQGKLVGDLTLIKIAKKAGCVIKDKDSGELWDASKILGKLCKDTATTLLDEGNRVSSFLDSMIQIYANSINKVGLK